MACNNAPLLAHRDTGVQKYWMVQLHSPVSLI